MPERAGTRDEFGVGRSPIQLSGALARNHYHRYAHRQHRPQFQPVAFAHATLEPITHHRIAHPARDRDAQPRRLVLCAAKSLQHEMSALVTRAAALEQDELSRFAQPVGPAEPQRGGPLPVYPGCLGGIVMVRR